MSFFTKLKLLLNSKFEYTASEARAIRGLQIEYPNESPEYLLTMIRNPAKS